MTHLITAEGAQYDDIFVHEALFMALTQSIIAINSAGESLPSNTVTAVL